MQIEKPIEPSKSLYRIAMTSSAGTAIAGDYATKTAAGAISKARAEHGDEWTYYLLKKINQPNT